MGRDRVTINPEMFYTPICLSVAQNCIIRNLLIAVEIGKDESFTRFVDALICV